MTTRSSSNLVTTILATTVLALAMALVSLPAFAGDIARWVDADGVTHFGNPQFGPRNAEPVHVEPANGMVAPTPITTTRAGGRPSVVVLEKQPNRDLVGWRGHAWTVSQNPRRNRHR